MGKRGRNAGLALLMLALLAGCTGSSAASVDEVGADQDVLRDLIDREPELRGTELRPRIGTPADRLLDSARFLSAAECGSPTGNYRAAATNFTGFGSNDGGLTGSVELWVATFDNADQAVAFHNEAVQLWDSCVDVFNATNLLQIERTAVARDLVGDGSGMGGVSARTTRVGTDLATYTYDFPVDRFWARVRISHQETATDPQADRARLLAALWRTLQVAAQ